MYVYLEVKQSQLLKTAVFKGRLLHDMTSALYIERTSPIPLSNGSVPARRVDIWPHVSENDEKSRVAAGHGNLNFENLDVAGNKDGTLVNSKISSHFEW